jgi:hypothetical protein
MTDEPLWTSEEVAKFLRVKRETIVTGPGTERSRAANSREEQKIELNVSANLVSGASVNCVVASSIHWHTSKLIRDLAESMSAELTSDGSRNWSKRWPSNDIMQLPVTGSL